MIRTKQVFTRAWNPTLEMWQSVDVFDLDDLSFRALVITKLTEMGALVHMKDEYCDGDEITLKIREGSSDE